MKIHNIKNKSLDHAIYSILEHSLRLKKRSATSLWNMKDLYQYKNLVVLLPS